jgi:hypothetical protein
MAESDAAGPGSADAPRGGRPLTLADAQREVERSLAPIRAFAAEAEKRQRQITAFVDSGIGRFIREVVGPPADPGPDPQLRYVNGPADSWPPREAAPPPEPPHPDPPLRYVGGPVGSRPANEAAQPTGYLSSVNPAPPIPPTVSLSLSADIVERIADEVVRRLAANPAAPQLTPPTPSRRGRKRRDISVGGVDEALEALAESNPKVRVLAARELEKLVPYCRRTIQDCPTYKQWRKALRALRVDAKAGGVSDLLEAGIVHVRTRKPGRDRLKGPKEDRDLKRAADELLRRAGHHEGIDGQ